MAYEISNYAVRITLVAASTVTAFNFVKLDSNGKAVPVSGATDRPIGVAQNGAAAGQEVSVVVSGGTKVISAGSVAINSSIGSGAAATAVPLAAGTDLTKYVVGTSLSAAASGEYASVVINCACPARAV